jgi:hypothetical protein
MEYCAVWSKRGVTFHYERVSPFGWARGSAGEGRNDFHLATHSGQTNDKPARYRLLNPPRPV